MKIRLHFPHSLATGEYTLNGEMSHYLCRVLRARAKARVFLFNADSGEWRGHITAAHPKQTRIVLEEQTRVPESPEQLKLYFAPIKKSRIASIFAMATELGATELQPLKTRFTHSSLGREDKIIRQLTEATEQCERLDIPTLLPPISWQKFCTEQRKAAIPQLACVETGHARPMTEIPTDPTPRRILIGPEGGFSPEEHETLQSWSHCIPVTLDRRILRSETAVAAALAQWNMVFRDGGC